MASFLERLSSLFSTESQLSWNKAEPTIRHFRTFSDIPKKPHLSPVGISGRYMSGSGQLTCENISQLAEKAQEVTAGALTPIDKIIIIDVRLESHGYINGLPVAWKVKNNDANLGKTKEAILQDEKDRLVDILQKKTIGEVEVQEVCTEEELAAKNNFEYVRLPTLDHSIPSIDMVETYLDIIRNNPNAWLHVHCHVGKGRTTTFMALYDMFHNAKNLEFIEILDRQKEIDGQDFLKHRTKSNLDARRHALFEERISFLQNFYRYCRESDPQTVSWQSWLQQQ